ncbi:MAG: tetratricopeptide repeat protein [Bacteroidota bacterium]
MKKGTCLLLMLCAAALYGRQVKVDSLLARAGELKDGEERCNTYNLLADEYCKKGDTAAYTWCLKALELAEKLDYKKGLAQANQSLGFYYDIQKSNYDSALIFYNKAISLAAELGDKALLASVYIGTGTVYYYKGSLDKSAEYYLSGLKNAEAAGDTRKQASALIGLGNVYSSYPDNTSKALDHFLRARDIYEKMGYKEGLVSAYANIAGAYGQKQEYDKALEFHFKAMTLEEELGYLSGLGETYSNIGVIYYYQLSFDKALEYFLKSMKLRESINDEKGMGNAALNIGAVYSEMKQYDRAIEYQQKALQTAKKINSFEKLQVAYEALAGTYRKAGKHDEAYSFLELSMAFRDSLLNEKASEQIAEMQTRYDTEKKDKDNQLLRAESEQKNLVIWFTGVVAAVMLLLVFFILRSYRHKQKANLALSALNREIELQKEIVEEKNKNITDSIVYAQRIQQSLLPTEKYIERCLHRHNKN